MFLSLVRPDRISSPMTRMAAVTMLMAFPFAETRYNASTTDAKGRRLMNQHARPAASAPHRAIAYAPARANRATDPDGTIRISCPAPLGAYEPSLARLFRAAVE